MKKQWITVQTSSPYPLIRRDFNQTNFSERKNKNNKYSANSTESNLKDALCHQQWYSWVQTCQHHQISAETRAHWNCQQVRGNYTIRITIKVKVDWAFWLRSPGEQKRHNNISVVGRLGRRRPQRDEEGRERTWQRSSGGEWWREIVAWHAGNDFLMLRDVRIVDS